MGSIHDKIICTHPYNHEFSKMNHTTKSSSQNRKLSHSRSKPTPSKWDDAQKWLVGSNAGPRNSNAEDRRLLAQKARDSCSSLDGELLQILNQEEVEADKEKFGVRSISLRDMGTEMTPVASREPSRNCTPIRARSPVNPRASTLVDCRVNGESFSCNIVERNKNGYLDKKSSSLEMRAMAWDEAERTKYMARYRREEVKIQAWENGETRKAEMQMKRIEVKAERMKSRAQEKLAKKIASTRRRAEDRHSSAEAKVNEQNAKTSERADYFRRAGQISSIFSFKLPSLSS